MPHSNAAEWARFGKLETLSVHTMYTHALTWDQTKEQRLLGTERALCIGLSHSLQYHSTE